MEGTGHESRRNGGSSFRPKRNGVLLLIIVIPVIVILYKVWSRSIFSKTYTTTIIQTIRPPIANKSDQKLLTPTPHTQSTGTEIKVSRLPNVVFMMADDLGYGDVGYNRKTIKTPHLDEMAAGQNTVHLRRYYSGSPVCSPTRGSVLTGRNPNRYCIWTANVGLNHPDFTMPQRMPLPTSEVTIADLLRKKKAYHTAIFGKWHVGDLKKLSGGNKKWPMSHPGMHGFERWLVTERSAPTTTINCGCFPDKSKCVNGHYGNNPACTNYYTSSTESEGELEAYEELIEGDDSKFIVDMFESYLKEMVPTGRPFFVYLPFHTVHHRYIAAKGYREMYSGHNANQVDYFGAISAMDTAIGRVRSLLREYNISDNTMLWFTSDNGPEANTPGSTSGLKGSKRSLYEGGIRVPGLIEWPTVIKQNHMTDYPVVSSDLLPTVCDIVGIPLSECPGDRPLDGESILPLLNRLREKRGSHIKWAYQIPHDFDAQYDAAISGDQYKVHATYDKGKIQSARLYDLVSDREEKKDLSSEKPELLESMKAELHSWWESVRQSAIEEVACIS